MKKRILTVATVFSLVLSAPAWAVDPTELSNALGKAVDKVPSALPFAAGAGLDWSDAYIGQLLDTDFPFVHLGVGVTLGATTLPKDAVNPVLTALGEAPLDLVPLPFAVANLRLGGLVLPFDVGIKAGVLDTSLPAAGDMKVKYQNFGFDVRYNLIKSDIVWPDVSVGGEMSFFSAGITKKLGADQSYSISGHTLTATAPTLNLGLSGSVFEAKVQVSKTILWIVTPYAGLAAGFGTGKVAAKVDADVNVDDAAFWKQYFGDISGSSFGKTGDSAALALKAYGGLSVDVLLAHVDSQLLYNIPDGAFGFTLGARLQL